MNTARSLALALALSTFAAALAIPEDALAANVFGPEGSVRLIPTPPVVAGGAPVDLVVVAQAQDGSPITGLVLKPVVSAGVLGAWTEVGGGLYKVQFQPTGLTAASEVTFTAKGKTPAKVTVNLVEKVRVSAPRPEVSAVAVPAELTLGSDPEASVTISGIGKGGLRSALSTGTLENIVAMPGGQYASRFVTPKVNFPQNAIVTLADASDPFAQRGYAVVKLNGKVDFPVKGDAGATVLLEIAGRRFGPTTLGPDGRGKVAIQVAPGVQRATQITIAADQERREEIDLRIPETKRLQLFPFPLTLPADGRMTVPLRVAVVKPDGAADAEATPRFTVSAGTVGESKHVGGGVYEASWKLPETPSTVRVDVTLGSDVQKDTAEVALVSRRPAAAKVTTRPATIDGATTSLDLTVALSDSSGGAFTGAEIGAALVNGQISGPPLATPDGRYELPVSLLGTGPFEAQLWAKTAASKNPVRGVVLVPERAQAPNDPAAPVDVLVATVDAFGLPVANVKVTLAVVTGGGSIGAADVTTGADGTARVPYAPGSAATLAALEGTAAGYVGTVAFLQVPGDAPLVALPAVGGEREVAWVQAWTASSPSITLPRAASAVAAVPVVVPAGVTVIDFTATPTSAPPNSDVKIVARALDAGGKSSKATAPTLTASAGSLAPALVDADGQVSTTLHVPAGATGNIEITATAGGKVMVFTVPVVAAVAAAPDASPWDTAPAAAPVVPPVVPPPAVAEAAAPEVVKEPKPPKVPRSTTDGEPEDFRWLRARGSGLAATYRYEQAPSAEPGPLIPSRLAVGGPDGGAPAIPVGGEVDVRAWGDELEVPYVGVHGQFRAAQYSIVADAFEGQADDALLNVEVDLLGRYPFDVAGDRYWVGGKVGYHYNDFLIFTGCLDPGCLVQFDPVGVSGLGLGAELGAEVGPVYLIGGYTLGLARGTDPYSNGVDVNVGVNFHPNVFADLGFGVLTRTVVLEGDDSGLERGSLSDSQMIAKLGVGFSM